MKVVNSPFGKAFKAIMARIQQEVKIIEHIDQDMGQLEGTSTRPAVLFPLILIDFKNWVFDDLGEGGQMGQGDVIIKFAYAQFTPSSNHVDEFYRDQALEYYEIEWLLNKALHNWSPGDEFSVMSRRNVDSQNILVGVRARPMVFRMEFEDWSCKPVNTIIHPGMSFEGHVD